jgi:hypothetical protein
MRQETSHANLGSSGAACEIGNRSYTIPTPPPPCAQHSAWGDRFGLSSSGVTMDCHNDTLHLQGEQVLGDGQTLSSGTFSCTAEPSAMRCTDSGQRPLLLHVAWFLPDRVTEPLGSH